MKQNKKENILSFKLLLLLFAFFIISSCVGSIKENIQEKNFINKTISVPICTKIIIQCYRKENLLDCISQFMKSLKRKKNKNKSSTLMMIQENNNIAKIKNEIVDNLMKKKQEVSYPPTTIVVTGGIIMIFALIIFMSFLVMKK